MVASYIAHFAPAGPQAGDTERLPNWYTETVLEATRGNSRANQAVNFVAAYFLPDFSRRTADSADPPAD
jgi:hypothetical protein